MQEMNFGDLTPVEVPVKIGGKSYLLKEATGDVACRYRNALLATTKLGPDGKPTSIVGMADVEPLLVSMCLCEVAADGGSRPVHVGTVRAWPQRVQKALFEKAKEISQLDEKEDKATLEEKLLEYRDKLAKLEEVDGDHAKKQTTWQGTTTVGCG